MALSSTIPDSKQVLYSLVCIFGLWTFSRLVHATRRDTKATPLRGPPRKNLLFGVSGDIQGSSDSSVLYEQWAKEYGFAYSVPYSFGSSQIILVDPKAVAEFYAQETVIWVFNSVAKRALERLTGRSLIWADGEDHRRQRKALSPAFGNTAIRKMTSIFFDSGYKVKAAWDALIDSAPSGEALIDVQGWMNRVSLDSIGIAGFSHDFRALHGEHPDAQIAFDSLSDTKYSKIDILSLMVNDIFPIIDWIPTTRKTLMEKVGSSLKTIVAKLLANSDKVGDQKPDDRSIIGLLIKDKDPNVESDSFSEDVLSQMKLLLVAAYETTSISLSWAIVELAQRTDAQVKLRKELSQFNTTDPTWDQLSNTLPYLDAVIHETLRVHPPVPITPRTAIKDNILPLSTPIRTLDGQLVNSLAIPKGTVVTVPIRAINRSEAFWGPDAKEFKPERWLTESGLAGAKDIQGHRHLLTFSDGQRACLGKAFALAEFKAVLSTLIRNFCFEMKEGATIETSQGVLPRPKIVGQKGLRLPMRVRRVE